MPMRPSLHLEARPNIHLVFTDIQMPGSMDGLKLAKVVKDRWPLIQIIATSGLVKLAATTWRQAEAFWSLRLRSKC
jgi:CheY-like chemotaxis protein